MSNQEKTALVRKLSFQHTGRTALFASLSDTVKSEILPTLDRRVQRELLIHVPDETLLQVMEMLDPDKCADLAQLLPHARAESLVEQLTEHLRETVAHLMRFDPETAAGIMNTDYVKVREEETVVDVAKRFRTHEKRTGRAPIVIVLRDGLPGTLPAHALALARPEESIRTYVRRLHTVHHNATHEDVVSIFRAHPHENIAVLNENGTVIGIIYAGDLLRILKEQETSALYNFAGIRKEESVADPASAKIKSRYKWLIINLGTAFLASFVVSLFQPTIEKFVLLAVYMPIVAGMGGNAATQTLAVLVRGIAMHQIDLAHAWPVIRREVTAGLVNGLINGLIVAGVVLLVNRDPGVALVLACAMVANLMVAGFFGTLIPLIMEKLGKDPAASATIFITTATDVLGFLVFLGLGTIVLG